MSIPGKIISCLFLFLVPVCLHAQTKTDSLLSDLAKAKTPKEKSEVCLRLSTEMQKTNNDESKKYADDALKFALQTDNKKTIANAHHALGTALQGLGKYDDALKEDSICLKIREEIKDTSGLAKILNNIGLTYSNKGESRKALEALTRALGYRKLANNTKGMPRTYTNIGLCYYDL